MTKSFEVSRIDWLKLIFLSTLWGMSFIFMEVAISELGTFTVGFFRVCIAAVTLNIIIGLQGRNLWTYRHLIKKFIVMGVIGIAIPFSLIIWGQIYITASLAAILNGTLPFMTLIVAHFFTQDEKMTLRRVMALIIGFVGVVVIIGPSTFGAHENTNVIYGEIALLLATVCYAVVMVYGRQFGKLEIPGLVAVTGQMTIASIVLFPLMLWEAPWTVPEISLPVLSSLAGVGLFSTALAFTIWYHLLPRIGSNNLSLVTFLIPISAITIGHLVLNETLMQHQIIGMAIVAIGLTVTDGRIWRRRLT